MSNITDEAGKLLDQNARTLAPVAVGTQVGLMTGISVSLTHPYSFLGVFNFDIFLLQIFTILVFNILRPRNKVIALHSLWFLLTYRALRLSMNPKSSITLATSLLHEFLIHSSAGCPLCCTLKSRNSWIKLVLMPLLFFGLHA